MATKRFSLRKDENIIETDNGEFQVEYLKWPNDPDNASWVKGPVYATRRQAVITILAARIDD